MYILITYVHNYYVHITLRINSKILRSYKNNMKIEKQMS